MGKVMYLLLLTRYHCVLISGEAPGVWRLQAARFPVCNSVYRIVRRSRVTAAQRVEVLHINMTWIKVVASCIGCAVLLTQPLLAGERLTRGGV